MFIKGLIDKKIFRKNLLIIFIVLFMVALLITIEKSMENKILKEYEKPQYRTLIFSSKKINSEIIEEYKDILEDYNIEDNDFTIIFKTKKDLDYFKEQNKDLIENITEVMVAKDTLSIIMSYILKIIIIVSFIIMLILIIVLNYNYYCNIKKEIALYNILGFSKSKVIFTLTIFFHIIYLILNFLSLLLIKIISLIFKFKFLLMNYYISFIIIFISLIITYIFTNIIFKNKNNLLIIKE